MAKLREVIQIGNGKLRKKAKPVADIQEKSIQSLIDDLILTLADKGGVGIAATQVGESHRIFIVAPDGLTKNEPYTEEDYLVCINPTILSLTGKKVKDWEGCLSVPGLRGLVKRPTRIKIEFTDRNGEELYLEAENFVARIFQHEYDHLEGNVFLDRVKNNRELISEQEYIKLFDEGEVPPLD